MPDTAKLFRIHRMLPFDLEAKSCPVYAPRFYRRTAEDAEGAEAVESRPGRGDTVSGSLDGGYSADFSSVCRVRRHIQCREAILQPLATTSDEEWPACMARCRRYTLCGIGFMVSSITSPRP